MKWKNNGNDKYYDGAGDKIKIYTSYQVNIKQKKKKKIIITFAFLSMKTLARYVQQ